VKHRKLLAVLTALPLLALACGGDKPKEPGAVGATTGAPAAKPTEDTTPVELTMWFPFTGREQKALEGVLKGFQAKYPHIKVKATEAIEDGKIIQGIRSGKVPDVAISWSTDYVGFYCATGGFQDLKPFIEKDKVDLNQLSPAVRSYTEFQGKRCALPVLHDAYGLYYNKDLLSAKGFTEPPKTLSELTEMTKKLTEFNADGSIKVAGFVPSFGWYENSAVHWAPATGAKWQDSEGKSSLASDANWSKLLTWQKELVDWYGYDKLKRFTAKLGDEWSADNAFQKGKVAIHLDGEWRTAFIKNEAPKLNYATAPMPVDEAQPNLYGGGYVSGTIVGMPKGAKNPDAAWKLIQHLAFETDALVELANGLGNIPSTTGSAASPNLEVSAQFKTFLEIAGHPATSTHPVTSSGAAYQELFAGVLEKWQAGNVSDLPKELASTDKQIDKQLEQVGVAP
jgi:multiple sugar transport system substrate-binding protein